MRNETREKEAEMCATVTLETLFHLLLTLESVRLQSETKESYRMFCQSHNSHSNTIRIILISSVSGVNVIPGLYKRNFA